VSALQILTFAIQKNLFQYINFMDAERNSPDAGSRTCKAKFTQSEDIRLAELVLAYGEGNWQSIARNMQNRSVRQCRERWTNYLSPTVVNGPWSPQDNALLLEKFAEFGPQWKNLTQFFTGRTDINIKNHYITLSRRRCKPIVHSSPQDPPVEEIADQLPKPIPPRQPPSLFDDWEADRPTLEWDVRSPGSSDSVHASSAKNWSWDEFFAFDSP
jgi:hypothetical protein